MSVPYEIKNMTEGVVSSFESGIETVGHLIEKGLELLDGYRAEQKAIHGSLRESLASVGSLRKKDFDGVMERISEYFSHLDRAWDKTSGEGKLKISSSMFPHGIICTRDELRTIEIERIYVLTKKYSDQIS